MKEHYKIIYVYRITHISTNRYYIGCNASLSLEDSFKLPEYLCNHSFEFKGIDSGRPIMLREQLLKCLPKKYQYLLHDDIKSTANK